MVSLLLPFASRAAFVYESSTEFLTTGDFNGDGIADVVVLDKFTGNARVGYQNNSDAFTWSAPLLTGVENVSGCAAGRFLQSNRDALAATGPEHNRVHLVNLSNTNSAGAPVIVTPAGVGPNLLVALATPYGTNASFDRLLAGSRYNSADLGVTMVELFTTAGAAVLEFQARVAGPNHLESGNALRLGTHPATFAAAMLRGSNAHFLAFSFTNQLRVVLQQSNLQPTAEYVFGTFNSEPFPRFVFYVPGASNLTVVPVTAAGSAFTFGSPTTVAISRAIVGVYYVPDGKIIIQFRDGIQGLTFPGGTPSLAPLYQAGLGAAGNAITGVVPLDNGRFALLDAPAGADSSIHAQVIAFDGAGYTQLSASNLTPLSTRATRANVWLFQHEPFVISAATFISSLNAPDWSSGVFGLPTVLSARVETDDGSSQGLGNPATNNLGIAPSGTAFGLPNQYRDDISFFSYTAPRPPEPVTVTISPPPGSYSGRILITLTPSDVSYRLNSAESWRSYSFPFALSNDTTIQYYGRNLNNGARSKLQFATYTFGQSNMPPPGPLTLPGGDTNPPPAIDTNRVIISSYGTVFYGRRNFVDPNGAIWAINLDGSGDRYVTVGARPRVSSDGRYLAFLRENNPFNNTGNIWVRDLLTGQEARLFSNTAEIVGYDWEHGGTNLFFDFSCNFWRVGLDGMATQLPVSVDCFADAPSYNPVDGRLAFHVLNSTLSNPGLYVTSPDHSSAQRLNIVAPNPRWPIWSPDGQHLVFVDGQSRFSLNSGQNLWIIKPDGTGLHPITGLSGFNGFPYGAIWSPAGDALVGVGTVFNSSGIWIIPLSEDRTTCAGVPYRLPTTPGDSIDFVGGIHLPPPPPQLFIRRDTGGVTVYWRRTVIPYLLETAANPGEATSWSALAGPFPAVGILSEHFIPNHLLANAQFFRLRTP